MVVSRDGNGDGKAAADTFELDASRTQPRRDASCRTTLVQYCSAVSRHELK